MRGSRRETGPSGEQRQRVDVARPDDREVPPVERRHLRDLETFRHCDHRSIARAEGEIRILLDQLGHARVVTRGQVHRFEITGRQASQETCFHLRIYATNQVADLGDDWRWYEDSLTGQVEAREQLDAAMMVGVLVEGSRDQRPCVTDDHGLPAEALTKQLVDPLAGVRFTSRAPEESWRPWTLVRHWSQMTSHLGQSFTHLVLRQGLDQAQQLFTLRAHTGYSSGVPRPD